MFVIVCSSTSCSWRKWETVFFNAKLMFFFTKCFVFPKRSCLLKPLLFVWCANFRCISTERQYIFCGAVLIHAIYTQTLGFPHRQSPLSQHRNGIKRERICKLWPMKRLAVELPAWAVYFYIPRWEVFTLREVHGIPGRLHQELQARNNHWLGCCFKCCCFHPQTWDEEPILTSMLQCMFWFETLCALDCTIWWRIMETEEEEPPILMIWTSESCDFSTYGPAF